MTEIKPVIAVAVVSAGKINVQTDASLTPRAAVVLTTVLVRQLAHQFALTPGEFLEQVKANMDMPVSQSVKRPTLVYNG